MHTELVVGQALPRVLASDLDPIEVDGKFFRCDGERFQFRGVTYGTFLPRPVDGALFPHTAQIRDDVEQMAAAGFTVVRTYTPPPEDLLNLAGDAGLRVLAGIFFPDWRYLVGASGREFRRVVRDAQETVREEVRRLRGDARVLAVCLANEIPADVLRWFGTKRIADAIDDLAAVAREEDPTRLVTYANYPTTEYLPLDAVDFLTFNVYLERRADLRRYLTRLHHLAGDRPLVLGEVGLHVGDEDSAEDHQAGFVDWQLETALERGVAGTCLFSWTDEWAVGGESVEGWRFGLTRTDRSTRPALDVASKWNTLTIRDLQDEWPSMSVVICAYNAASTLDECLRHTCALDYPGLEIIVVDDGSTDETAAIARAHPRARLVPIEHAGLSVARNAGLGAATGDIVAYLDADAFPSPEWPYYLCLAFDGRQVGGAGGPNIPPRSDGPGAECVAQAPGGPVHVLVADDRAEHVPGCNMAFWREVLVGVGGFDPIYTAAGDDVDVCWKVLDAGWEIGFHPAALVWHHRRSGLRPYLRQQRGYGRSEALVEARHPDRFTPAGTARWRGRIYNPAVPLLRHRQRIYRGPFGTAAYQSVYQAGGHGLDLAHQIGVPAAALAVATLPLGLLVPRIALLGLAGLALLLCLTAIDASNARPPRKLEGSRLRFRLTVAVHHLLQPLVRSWGRTVSRPAARLPKPPEPLPGPVTMLRGGLLLPATHPRAEVAAALIGHLRGAGYRTVTGSEWDAVDARLLVSSLVTGELVTSAHPEGWIQVRVRRRPNRTRLAMAAAAIAVASTIHALALVALVVWVSGSVTQGVYRTGRGVRLVVRGAATA